MRHLRGSEEEDHRHDHRARLEDAAVALGDLGAVRKHHHHAVARCHAQAPEGVGEAARRAVGLHVGDLPPLEGQRHELAVLVEAVLADPGQVHGAVSYRGVTRNASMEFVV